MLNSKLEMAVQKIRESSEESKIYLGCDSIKKYSHGKAFVRYATVVIIHFDGKRGADVIGFVDEDQDYDQAKRPITRLMNEAYRVSDLYLKLKDAIGERHVEIHLDINPNPNFASNMVYSQALGVVKGMCEGVETFTKPEAFAASIAADRLLSL